MTPGDRLRVAIVSFGGAGLSPFAPGTAGSVAAVLVALALEGMGQLRLSVLGALIVVVSVANVALGAWVERHYQRKDPGQVVLDECAGQWLALLPLCRLDSAPIWLYAFSFTLFRLLDILKPLGARRLEQLPRGWGILLDDVLTGLYSAALVLPATYLVSIE